MADAHGWPLAVTVASGFPHEATLVETTLQNRFVTESPEYLTGDRAYDSDPLGKQLVAEEIELIAPHRQNRQKLATQDVWCV